MQLAELREGELSRPVSIIHSDHRGAQLRREVEPALGEAALQLSGIHLAAPVGVDLAKPLLQREVVGRVERRHHDCLWLTPVEKLSVPRRVVRKRHKLEGRYAANKDLKSYLFTCCAPPSRPRRAKTPRFGPRADDAPLHLDGVLRPLARVLVADAVGWRPTGARAVQP